MQNGGDDDDDEMTREEWEEASALVYEKRSSMFIQNPNKRHQGIPFWYYVLMWIPHPSMVAMLRRCPNFNVNALPICAYTGKRNFLYFWHYGFVRNVKLLQALLDAGITVGDRDEHGFSLVDFITQNDGVQPAYMPTLKLLIDYGCQIAYTLCPSLAGYAARSTSRKQAVRVASATMLLVLRPSMGRDVAAMVARLVWCTRRHRTVWKPSEEEEDNAN